MGTGRRYEGKYPDKRGQGENYNNFSIFYFIMVLFKNEV